MGNGSHGFYFHDGAVVGNCNSVTIDSPLSAFNTGDGFRFGSAANNLLLNPNCESNTGTGLRFVTGAQQNTVIGGDVNEANVAGNLTLDSGSLKNFLFGVNSDVYTDNGTGNLIIGINGNKGFSKVGNTTRDISLTTTQSITGVGFMPSYVRLVGNVDATAHAFWGVDDGTTRSVNYYSGGLAQYGSDQTKSLALVVDGTNHAKGTVAMDADGFTITWTKTGTPSGTLKLTYEARR